MPRALRCDSPLRVLNIGQKGHNGQIIFYYDEDREYYLECLQNACKKFGVVLLGYVLMSNHIHALFYGDIEKCASVFQSIGSTYVRWFNRKYGRTGTLWNSRFYSKPVQDEQQFLQTAAYIFNNPVKAGIVKRAENYRWSSFRDMDTKKFDEKAREILDSTLSIAYLKQYTHEAAEVTFDSDVQKQCEVIPNTTPSDLEVIDAVKRLVKSKNLGKIPTLSRSFLRKLVKELLKFGSNISQISRITTLTRHQVSVLAT